MSTAINERAGSVTTHGLEQAPRGLLGALAGSGVWEWGSTLCLWALVAAAALNGMSLSFHSLSVYPEYIAIGLVGLWLAIALVAGQVKLYLPVALVPLTLWLGAELLATLLNAPVPHQSLVLWVKLPLVTFAYLAVAYLARGRLGRAVAAQVVLGVAVALAGIAAYTSWRLTGSHFGVQQPGRNLGQAWLPAATLREPDIFGSYLVAVALLLIPLTAYVRRTAGGWWLVAGGSWLATRGSWLLAALSITVFGAFLSGSRTAWVALVASLFVAAALGLRPGRRALMRWALPPCAAALGIIGVLAALRLNPLSALPLFNPQANGSLAQRIVSFGSLTRDRNIVTRVEIARNALTYWRVHPITGWGVGAYGEQFNYPPPDTVHRGWIANLPVHLLYDSGILGLVTFTAAIVLAAYRGVRAWWGDAGFERAVLAGTLLALLGLLIAFQATEATWFAYPWLYLGLLEAAVRTRKDTSRRRTAEAAA